MPDYLPPCQVSSLPASQHVALLDLSARDLTRLPARIFQDLDIEGLVVSSGQLANLSTKAFHGLEVTSSLTWPPLIPSVRTS